MRVITSIFLALILLAVFPREAGGVSCQTAPWISSHPLLATFAPATTT